MATDNLFGATASIVPSGTFDIKPITGSGIDWVINNIYYNNQLTFSMTDGTNVVDFYSDTVQGSRMGIAIYTSTTYWLRITNTGTNPLLIAYDGTQTS